MDFGKFDIVIIFTMTMAVVGMAFTMPALGLSSASAEEGDIPEFDMTADRFDFTDDFPDRPGTPSSGTLFINNSDVAGSNWNVSIGTSRLILLPDDGTGDGTIDEPVMGSALFHIADPGTNDTHSWEANQVGDSVVLSIDSDTVRLTLDFVDNLGQPDFTWGVSYEVIDEDESEETWLDRIPLLGPAVSGIGELAGIIGWGISIIWWGITWFFEIALNLLNILFDVATYLSDMMVWLVTTYTDIIESADSWAAIFVSIPAVLLFAEFAKITFIGIRLLPST